MVPHSDRDIGGSACVAVVVVAVDQKGLAALQDLERILSSHESHSWGLHDSAGPSVAAAVAAAAAEFALARVRACRQHPR